MPTGCRFEPRCPYAFDTCRTFEPPLRPISGIRTAACWLNVPRHDHPVAGDMTPKTQTAAASAQDHSLASPRGH
jgi:hypothetical protein